ncbi:hypothetical protein WIS52_11835 [Pseudonocardia nematodicida]|uniref:Uncharacterized protein n=1 Tax=Pseudonocardia nematodicida TaxID=1206997 RepID=A0ABV1K9L1_9PSEU
MIDALQSYSMVGSNWVFDSLRTACFQAIRQGLTEDEFIAQVHESPLALDSEHRSESLETKARKVYAWCDNKFNYGNDIPEKIDGMVQWVFDHEWSKGRAGINERAACLAILARCQEMGAYSPNVSARWLASQLGMTDQVAAGKIRERLVQNGFMTLVASTRRYGNQYRINLECVPRTTNKLYRYNLFVVVRTGLELGHVPAWIHHMLPETTTSQAAATLGVSKSTAEKAVGKLADLGLLTKVGKVYHRTGMYTPALDAIPNRFADEQAKNREAVEQGYRDRHDKETNDRAELLASLSDRVGETRLIEERRLVSGSPFGDDAVYETIEVEYTSVLQDWLEVPQLVWCRPSWRTADPFSN